MQTEVKNLVDLYNRATPEQVKDGRSWYRNLRTWCQEVADLTDLSLQQVVGITAALSPLTPVSENLKLAFECAADLPTRGHPFYAKALAFRDQDAPLDILGKRKTRAFAESILTAGQSSRVCFDSWAYRAMTGDIVKASNGRHKHDDAAYKRYAANDKGYARAVATYNEAADIVGAWPGNFQAITWCAIRGASW